jgi:hypothetical protein
LYNPYYILYNDDMIKMTIPGSNDINGYVW